MSRLPSPYPPGVSKYDLGDITLPVVPGRFQGTGTDYSELSGHVVYFTSVPLERTVAFKAFFESIKINLQKDIEETNKAHQNFSIISEKQTELSYDITLNIPAHSVNESVNNIAKLEELQRLILPGPWSNQSVVVNKGTAEQKTEKTVIGASKRTNTINPIFTVLFKNIINSGFPYVGDYKNLTIEQLLNLGFPCYIQQVNYEPAQDAGHFELHGHIYPKLIKLTLKLFYDSEVLVPYTKNYALKELSSFNGTYNTKDTSLFPFHALSHVSPEEPSGAARSQAETLYGITKPKNDRDGLSLYNKIFSTNEKIETYIYISLPAVGNFAILFKPFLTNFSRNVQIDTSVNKGSLQAIHNTMTAGGSSISPPEYLVEFDVVANTLLEAKYNAEKIQILCRLFLKRSTSDDDYTALKSAASEHAHLFFPGFTADIASQDVMVYIPSMIERPKDPPNKTLITNSEFAMFDRSVNLFLQNFSFDIEMDMGFFEDGSKIFPKAYKISLSLKNRDANLIRPYKMKKSADKENVVVHPKKKPAGSSSAMLTKDNAYLFPYNRKTVKIGGQ